MGSCTVVEHLVGAEVCDELQVARAAGGGDVVVPELGELNGVRADATGRRGNQDVGATARAVKLGANGLQGLETSEAGHGQPCGVRSGYSGGEGDGDAFGCCYVLGEAASFLTLQFSSRE